jgi:3-dehydroquinate dehydratase-2
MVCLVELLVVSGPNLNLLGRREPHIYGSITLEQIYAHLSLLAGEAGANLVTFQSNHEGALVDFLQAHMESATGALLNPGAFTHYSIALLDAVKALPFPVIEVHLSNIHAREEWRRHSVISPASRAQVVGFGWYSYVLALQGLLALLREEKPRTL